MDILVEFAADAHVGLLKYVELEMFFAAQLGVKADIVTKEGLKPSLKDRVLSEVFYV